GRLPLLSKQGFTGSIFCTPPTKSLTNIVLQDAQHLMADNNHRMNTPILFDVDDVKNVDGMICVMNYHTQFEVIPGVNVMLYDAGHILGSAFAVVDIDAKHTADSKARRIVFSGDIGNNDVPILPETESISNADIVICESTYGDREHEPVDTRMTKLRDMIKNVIGDKGTLLIPAFSIERTQELLYELDRMIDDQLIPNCPIYLDSPLSIKATEIYQEFANYLRFDRDIFSSPDRDFFSFPNLHVTLTVDASKSINDDDRSKIIIAGAGMMNGGRILHHLKRYIEDLRSGILIIGYQAEGTLGRRIFDRAEKVRIYGDEYDVKAKVGAIGAFSAHGDRRKLRQWLKTCQEPIGQIFLVHGDADVKENFKIYLEKELGGNIEIPKYWQSFEW
ncbi:MAG: MBL fold metallo-hydrolase, partial [Patescibacteria group bacterium]